MLPSGNDAAVALAENFGYILLLIKQRKRGKELTNPTNIGDPLQLFVQEMNSLAAKFHLKKTKFSNPHGLADKGNKSTASDIGRLAAFAMKNKTIC